MAPEMLSHQEYSFKADVWSLGVMLYQMLTTKRPFAPEDKNCLLLSYENGSYKIPSGLSVNCADFLAKCLKFNSEIRADWTQLLDHPFLSDS